MKFFWNPPESTGGPDITGYDFYLLINDETMIPTIEIDSSDFRRTIRPNYEYIYTVSIESLEMSAE